MSIVFFCQSCGSRFEVNAAMAGKIGHCKKCDQRMPIPKAAQLASMTAMPAVAAAGSGGPSWLERVNSDIGLKPLTVGAIKPVAKPSPLDDASNSALYELVQTPQGLTARQPEARMPVRDVRLGWKGKLGKLQKALRWVNNSAYLVSIPFVMIILTGASIKNRPLALFGATVVVLLNLGRMATGLLNLLIIPFRESVGQGLLFLLPPFTVMYLAKNWKGMKPPFLRVAVPAITIALVFLAFSFVPWLSRGGEGLEGSPKAQLRAGFSELRQDISGQLERVSTLNLNQIEARGGAELARLKAQLTGSIADARKAQGLTAPPPAPGASTLPGTTLPSNASLQDLVKELQSLRNAMTDVTQ